jgi:hypothetical protein
MDQDNCHTKPCYPGQVFFCNLSPKKQLAFSAKIADNTFLVPTLTVSHSLGDNQDAKQNRYRSNGSHQEKSGFLDPGNSEFQQCKTIGKKNSKKQHYLYTLNPIHVQRFRHCGHPFTMRMSQEHTILCCKPHAVVSKGL